MQEHRALNSILAPGGITAMYQPICAVDGTPPARLAGFECLSRGPKGTNFEAANVLFDYVRLKREELLVDRACVSAALMSAPRQANVRLSVNVHASTLGRDRDFVSFFIAAADRNEIPLSRLTIEIVEHAPPWDNVSFLTALAKLRESGVKIALDDVGLGQSNFKMMIDVCPDYLKIDRYFVERCDTDPNRRAVIEALLSLASTFGAQLVAEGVSTAEVVETLRGLGVSLMQGYLFAKPLTAHDAARYAIDDLPPSRPMLSARDAIS
jgi:EAL domain-containing protein (putative c-di-GMP-specific phosphodiesterase class I)